MQTVYFQGTPCHIYGAMPGVGEKASCFNLVTKDLTEISCTDFKGRTVVLNIFPSLDTSVCAMSVRRFDEVAAEFGDVVVLCVSMDLPFAARRFCVAEGIDDVIVASAFRSPTFAQKYGVLLIDGPLAGLLTRAVLILDGDRRVVYRDMPGEITNEPNYEGAIRALKGLPSR